MAITHSTHGPALREGIDAFFGTGYALHDAMWKPWYKEISTKKSWAEFLSRSGFSVMSERAVLAPTESEDPGLGYLVQIRPLAYGKKFAIAEETKDDDINGVSKDFVKQLLECAKETEAVLAHVLFNDGFAVNGYDSVPLFSASHPRIGGGTFSNLITAADLSQDLMESYHIAISDAQDDQGNQVRLKPKMLLVPTEMAWTAKEILGSSVKPDAMNDSINPAYNYVPWVSSPHLTDPDATVLLTDCPSGLVCIKRKAPFLRHGNDDDTLAMYTWLHMRIVFSYLNSRAAYGCAGS